jgi:hypothetical protein
MPNSQSHPVPDAALDADIAILGKKGRGKTFTAKGLVERLLQMGRRVIVLDPLSVWWGLKASADGKSPGFPIVCLAGPRPIFRLLENPAMHWASCWPALPFRRCSIWATCARPSRRGWWATCSTISIP